MHSICSSSTPRCWNWKEYTKIWEKNHLIGSCVRRLLDVLGEFCHIFSIIKIFCFVCKWYSIIWLLNFVVPCQMVLVKLPYQDNRLSNKFLHPLGIFVIYAECYKAVLVLLDFRWSSGSKIGREHPRTKIVHHPTWCHFLQVFQVQKVIHLFLRLYHGYKVVKGRKKFSWWNWVVCHLILKFWLSLETIGLWSHLNSWWS